MLPSACGESTRSAWNVDAWFQPKRFAFLLALLTLAAFPDIIFGSRTFFYRDFGIFGYPLAYYHRESFWRGEIPLWNPLNNCGIPFLAQWNTMVLYPLSLFYVLLPLSWSLGVFCVLHLYLAGFGMYFLSHEWTGNRLAAAVAGVAFAFNGLTLSCLKWPNNIAALAWMPCVVLLVERGWRQGGRALVLGSLAGATQMLSGGPEVILFTWVIVLALWLAQLFSRDNTGPTARLTSRGWKPVGLTGARFAAIVALVAGLASAQMLPFFDLLVHSQRGATYSDGSWAMPKWGWANFLVPLFRCFPSYQGVFAQQGQYWISSYYSGIGVIALALFALVLGRHYVVRLLAVTTVLSLALSLGPEGFLYGWLRQIFPPLEIVRFPIKFVVMASFALPMLAAFGIATLCDLVDGNSAGPAASGTHPSSSQRIKMFLPILTVGCVLFVLIGVILWFARSHPLPTDHWSATWQSGLSRGLFLALILCTAAFLTRVQRNSVFRALGCGLLVLFWLDVMTHAPRLSPTIERWVYEPGLAGKELKLNSEPRPGQSRAMVSPLAEFRLNHLALTNAVDDFLYSRLSLFANANLLDGIPKVDGFFSLYLRQENQVRSLLYASTNASWPSLESFLGVSQITAKEKVIQWDARSNYLPWATGGQAPVFADDTTALRGIIDTNFDPLRTVYLPAEALGQISATNAADAKIQITRFGAHRIELAVEAKASSWVVIAQTFYHPWQAYIDGRAGRVWRANDAFQAIEVPAGRHTVQLNYEDRAFRAGAALSVLTFLICAGLWYHWKVGPVSDRGNISEAMR